MNISPITISHLTLKNFIDLADGTGANNIAKKRGMVEPSLCTNKNELLNSKKTLYSSGQKYFYNHFLCNNFLTESI